ncbi:OmpW/AlkL family protein [Mucilaginibacter aquariorum]|uniref:OmpW family protein n=1 Tax=Mucilaginibacter aquariorum TaxID=2967225 RepID=A0ABT1T3P3_9SPHI|nr:OmpW family outer membrane protein [Mucilaginibacter aquariorum]MCQ6959237.1 OmpW family protein [Mucilaginibacter aquariorum]
MKKIKFYLAPIGLFLALNSFAQEKHEWDFRLRAITVVPQESAAISVIGGNIALSNSFAPELDITYFFARNFSAELILGTVKHTVKTTGSDLSAIGGPSSAEVGLGSVWLLPPTLNLQYHLPMRSFFKPYVGAGANYTIFYGADKGAVVQDIAYKDRFAFAAQAGLDVDLNRKVFLNIDLKKLWLSTTATVNAANLTPSGSPALAPVLQNIKADVKINPWVIGVGIGYRLK